MPSRHLMFSTCSRSSRAHTMCTSRLHAIQRTLHALSLHTHVYNVNDQLIAVGGVA